MTMNSLTRDKIQTKMTKQWSHGRPLKQSVFSQTKDCLSYLSIYKQTKSIITTIRKNHTAFNPSNAMLVQHFKILLN